MFTVDNPDPVIRWIADGDIPLLYSAGSIKPVELPINDRMLEKPIVIASNRQHAFHYHSVNLVLMNLAVLDLNCGGSLCDGIDAYSGSSLDKDCPCYQATSREANMSAVFAFRVVLEKEDDEGNPITFHVINHTSKTLTSFFMQNESLPVGIRANLFTADRHVYDEFLDSVEDVLRVVNTTCGFTVTGWVKRGIVADQGVSQPDSGQRHLDKRMIQAGNVTYHLTSVKPAKKMDTDMLNTHRYPVDDLIE